MGDGLCYSIITEELTTNAAYRYGGITMTMFKKEQYESLTAETKQILEDLGEGKSARDVMAQIYVDNLEDKTLKQGELMADGILRSVKNFDAGYQAAQEDLDRFLEEFQQKACEGKSCVERCNYWLKLAAAIAAANDALEDGADQESALQKLEGLDVPEDQATPEREAQLRDAAMEAMRNSGILLGTLMRQDAVLDELDSAKDAASLLIGLSSQETEFRAVAAMLAYTKIKNGSFEGMPADITAEQVTAMVCAGVEQARILEAVGDGSMAVDIATALLFLLGAVLLAALAMAVAAGAILVAGEFLNILFLIPAVMMIAGGILWLFGKAAGAWMTECRLVVTPVAAAVRLIIKGGAAVAGFVRGTVLPAAVRTAGRIREKLAVLYPGPRKVDAEVNPE